jgi:hypothetical protein
VPRFVPEDETPKPAADADDWGELGFEISVAQLLEASSAATVEGVSMAYYEDVLRYGFTSLLQTEFPRMRIRALSVGHASDSSHLDCSVPAAIHAMRPDARIMPTAEKFA